MVLLEWLLCYLNEECFLIQQLGSDGFLASYYSAHKPGFLNYCVSVNRIRPKFDYFLFKLDFRETWSF